jgi:hypothetical protein
MASRDTYQSGETIDKDTKSGLGLNHFKNQQSNDTHQLKIEDELNERSFERVDENG